MQCCALCFAFRNLDGKKIIHFVKVSTIGSTVYTLHYYNSIFRTAHHVFLLFKIRNHMQMIMFDRPKNKKKTLNLINDTLNKKKI